MTDIDRAKAIEAVEMLDWSQLEFGEMPHIEEILATALPHILAQAEARVKPSREGVAHAIWGCTDLHRAVLEDAREIADAVLALLPGKTEQEVREEVAREHEEKMDRLLEGEWQAGYVAGNNDQLNGTICGRRRAANERIARGGERS